MHVHDRAEGGRFRPSRRLVVLLAWAALVVNVVIVVTGAAVRLTESGLGCPDWPTCDGDSLTSTPEMGLTGAIEFGNRVLGLLVGAVTLVAVVGVARLRGRPAGTGKLVGLVLAGVLAQGVLGGITVLTQLHPLTVAAHFLLSMAVLVVAAVLVERLRHPSGFRRASVPRAAALLGRVLVGLLAVVLVLGTLVTGTGPHSGDRFADRLDLDPLVISQVHADAVFATLGVLAALLVVLFTSSTSRVARRRAVLVAVLAVAQGTVGYVQYFTGLPVLLVGAHVLGATLLWVATLFLLLALPTRRGEPVRERTRDDDEVLLPA